MTGTLRDRLAAVLGPGNDDTTAYLQADAVLAVLAEQPAIPEGWSISNGWIIEELPPEEQRFGDPSTGPADTHVPLFDLRTLPGWDSLADLFGGAS